MMYRDFEITPSLIYIIVTTWHFVRVLVLRFIYSRRSVESIEWYSVALVSIIIPVYTRDDNEQRR